MLKIVFNLKINFLYNPAEPDSVQPDHDVPCGMETLTQCSQILAAS